MSSGRRLPTGGDDGRPDVRLVAALADLTADDSSLAARSEVWAALVTARVFLPLATQRTAATFSEADMVLIMLGSASGARALPAFTDGYEVQRWRAEARPVPVAGPQACRMALDDGAQALLLDPAGAALVVSGADLAELAAGRAPVAGAGLSSRLVTGALDGAAAELPAGLLALLGQALAPEPSVRSARVLQGPEGPVVGLVLDRSDPGQGLSPGHGVDLGQDLAAGQGVGPGEGVDPGQGGDPARGVDPAGLVRLAERVRARLGAALPADGLDLAVVEASGPGQPVPLSRPASGPRPRWVRLRGQR